MDYHDLPDLAEIRKSLQTIKRHIFDYRMAQDYQPVQQDFHELVLIKAELSDTASLVIKLVEYWGLNK